MLTKNEAGGECYWEYFNDTDFLCPEAALEFRITAFWEALEANDFFTIRIQWGENGSLGFAEYRLSGANVPDCNDENVEVPWALASDNVCDTVSIIGPAFLN